MKRKTSYKKKYKEVLSFIKHDAMKNTLCYSKKCNETKLA